MISLASARSVEYCLTGRYYCSIDIVSHCRESYGEQRKESSDESKLTFSDFVGHQPGRAGDRTRIVIRRAREIWTILQPFFRTIIGTILQPIHRTIFKSILRAIFWSILQTIFKPIFRTVLQPVCQPFQRFLSIARSSGGAPVRQQVTIPSRANCSIGSECSSSSRDTILREAQFTGTGIIALSKTEI